MNSDRIEVVLDASGEPEDRVDQVRPSPGGDLIAYSWWNVADQRWELRTIARTGGLRRPLHIAAIREYVTPLSWTPDDSRVAAVQTGGSNGEVRLSLFSMNPETPAQVIARFPTGSITAASVSPDGRWIAYDYTPGLDDERDVYVARAFSNFM